MPPALSWERKIQPNGLTFLLLPRPSSLTAQLSVAVKYGSNDDAPEHAGYAHFLEHMIVGGTQKRINLHHEIEKFGGCSYFETSSECTFTKVDVFPDKIGEASGVLSELLFDSEFDAAKLEIERKVILNEIAEAADDPRDKIGETLIKSLFKHHPVRNPISGTKKTINQLAIRDLETCHQEYYVPKNMIVILTGNFSDKDAQNVLGAFVDRKNNSSPAGQAREVESGSPQQEKELQRSGILQAYLSFGFRTVPTTNPDAPALDLIDSILGTGESSRLFVELREKRALTYDFEAINVSGLDYGYFIINCAVKTNLLKQTQAIIRGELEKIKTQPMAKAELEKSKNLMVGSIYRGMDDPHELPRILADSEIQYKNENALQNYIDQINRLTEKNLAETANRYFLEENYATAIMTPKK
jgi:predicted Zn-dependent peptidase